MAIQKWSIDPSHSEVSFKVKHLMITTITGYFEKFILEVETDANDFKSVRNIEFTADINAINTHDIQRDEHLKSADFFNSEKYNFLKFTGTDYHSTGTDATLTGALTIGAVTKTVSLHVVYAGTVLDGDGQIKAGFSVTGTLSRREFGLTWDAVTEAGNIVVSDEVRIGAEIELIKQVLED